MLMLMLRSNVFIIVGRVRLVMAMSARRAFGIAFGARFHLRSGIFGVVGGNHLNLRREFSLYRSPTTA